MGKVAPRSPKLNCPTAHSPEEETQVLMSCPDVREGPVRPGRGGRVKRVGSVVGEGSGAGLRGWTEERPLRRCSPPHPARDAGVGTEGGHKLRFTPRALER